MSNAQAKTVVLTPKIEAWAKENGREDHFELARRLRDDYADSRGVTIEKLEERAARYRKLGEEAAKALRNLRRAS